MASVNQTQGTTVTWTSAGGDEVLTLTSLADAAGREGEEHDFTATFPQLVRIELLVDVNVAPTAGEVIEVWWSSSDDGTNYDAECTGGDAAFTVAGRYRLHFVGALYCTNDTDPQRQSWLFYLPARYGLPVVINESGQALTATGTDQVVTVTPLIGDIT